MNEKEVLSAGIAAIEKQGMLLVFPLNNQKEPVSLWSSFHPRSQMKWEWDEGGDDRVARLWHLREELSRSGKVVYAKWYRGRATFFSKKLFTSALRVLNSGLEERILKRDLSRAAQTVFEILQSDSPLSGKMIRKLSELSGKDNEKMYTRALKQLWDRLLIVGHGEIDDGAFPSLALGATSVVFERLWSDSLKVS
ncbi:MAG: hypothetical protein H7222_17360, partial [Methylotenera sp.]|nr:hypothetical protein [Oligoflexia bacterium]